ncbi:transcription factor SOX-18-like [Dermacentor albipictus]|uniref:transcription factor SOX-18-like n=1 Tax=Dermacentor albipictus TaxID=60249 RepID=UPI0038FD0CEE
MQRWRNGSHEVRKRCLASGGVFGSVSDSTVDVWRKGRAPGLVSASSKPAAESPTAVPAVASDPGVGVASSSSEVHHSYQLRSRIPRPPNASMLVAHGKRQLVAAENSNENNQRVSSRPGKLWRSLSVADKEPRQRKAAAAAAAKRCKRQARRTKAIASKLKNCTSGDEQQQPSISTAVAHGRGSLEFQHQQHPLPPPQRKEQRATSAARGSDSGEALGMPLPRPSATVKATASSRSAARPSSTGSTVLCHHQCEGPTEKTLSPPLS